MKRSKNAFHFLDIFGTKWFFYLYTPDILGVLKIRKQYVQALFSFHI